jgi:hypothetical protein
MLGPTGQEAWTTISAARGHPDLLSDVIGELLSLVQAAVAPDDQSPAGEQGVLQPDELSSYAARRHGERLRRITDEEAANPAVDELTELSE